MARSDWNIKGIIVYTAWEFKDDPCYGMKMDIYDYSFFETNYIPIKIIKNLLRISEQKFVDILNEDITSKKHLITNYEEQFRSERNITYGYKSLFTKEQVFGGIPDLSVELADFEDWLDDNYELLKENRATPKEDCCLPDIGSMQAHIAELEAENDKLKERVTELESALQTDGEAGGWLELYPMCEMIRTLHIAGESRDDIRLALMNKGYSNAQTAFLTQEDTNIRTDNAQKQAMKRVKSKMVGT